MDLYKKIRSIHKQYIGLNSMKDDYDKHIKEQNQKYDEIRKKQEDETRRRVLNMSQDSLKIMSILKEYRKLKMEEYKKNYKSNFLGLFFM
jgi:hypothetical protein